MNDTHDIFDPDLGFDEIAVGAESFAALALLFGRQSGHHDHFDVLGFGRGMQDVEHIKTTDFRHHHIADDELRTLLDCHSKRFFAVSC